MWRTHNAPRGDVQRCPSVERRTQCEPATEKRFNQELKQRKLKSACERVERCECACAGPAVQAQVQRARPSSLRGAFVLPTRCSRAATTCEKEQPRNFGSSKTSAIQMECNLSFSVLVYEAPLIAVRRLSRQNSTASLSRRDSVPNMKILTIK